MVLVVATLTAADAREVIHKLDRPDPLYVLEAQLVLAAQTQWCPMHQWQHLAIHLVGKNRQFVLHVLYFVSVVVHAAVATFSKRVKDSVPGRCGWFYKFQDMSHRNACPFRNARPALNAVVDSNLFLLGHLLQLRKTEFLRLLNQPIDTQFVGLVAAKRQLLVLRRCRKQPIRPQKRRYVLLAVLSLRVPEFH